MSDISAFGSAIATYDSTAIVYEDVGTIDVTPPSGPVCVTDDFTRTSCGITDTLVRTVASGWGTSDYGAAWSSSFGSGSVARVDTDHGVLITSSGGGETALVLPLSVPDQFNLTFDFQQSSSIADAWWALLVTTSSGYEFHVNIDDTSTGGPTQYIQSNGDSFTNIVGFHATAGTWYTVRFARDATLLYFKAWVSGTVEPGSWTTTTSADFPFAFTGAPVGLQFALEAGSSPAEMWFRNIDVPGFNRCGSVDTGVSGQLGTGPLGTWVRYFETGTTTPNSTDLTVVPAYAGIESGRAVSRFHSGSSGATGRTAYHVITGRSWTFPIEFTWTATRESISNNGVDFQLHNGVTNFDMTQWLKIETTPVVGGSPSIFMQWNTLTDGDSANISSGLNSRALTTNQLSTVRWRLESNRMLARMWAVTDTEPTTWDLTLVYTPGLFDSWISSATLLLEMWSHATGATYLDSIEACAESATGSTTVSAPTFVNSERVSSWPAVSSLSVSKPAGTVAGDLMILSVLTDSGTSENATCSGFVDFYTHTYSDGSISKVMQKVAGGSEGSSYTVNVSPSTGMNVVMTTWRNAGLASASAAIQTTAPYDVITTGTDTLSVSNGMAVAIFQSSSFGPGDISTAAGYTEAIDSQDFFVQQAVDYSAITSGPIAAVSTTISNPDSGSPARIGILLTLNGLA